MENRKKNEILSLLPFVAVDLKSTPPFCVDGRAGERKTQGLYPQTLGGSFHFVALRWLLDGGDFKEVFNQTLTHLKNLGLPLGFHRDTHAHGENAGCGFVDNNRKIITTLKEKKTRFREF